MNQKKQKFFMFGFKKCPHKCKYNVYFLQWIHYDFLKKLVSEDCFTPLPFMSLCVFLAAVFLTGDGRFSWDTGGLIIIWGSSLLASVDSLSQTFSVTVRKKNRELKIQQRRRPREHQKRNRFRLQEDWKIANSLLTAVVLFVNGRCHF